MIVFTPVDLPIIQPDNWDVFWDIWNKHSDWLVKIGKSANTEIKPGTKNLWIGLDIFKKYNYKLAFDAPYYDIKNQLPILYKKICKLDINVIGVRLMQSQCEIGPHNDNNKDVWEIRAFFHQPSEIPQWYFTKPDRNIPDKFYINMPKTTNWFMFNDKHCYHASNFYPDKKKILLQLITYGSLKHLIDRSIKKYSNYTLSF